jgi:hypothetical protein
VTRVKGVNGAATSAGSPGRDVTSVSGRDKDKSNAVNRVNTESRRNNLVKNNNNDQQAKPNQQNSKPGILAARKPAVIEMRCQKGRQL